MSERGQHWQAIAITAVLHLLPLLLLVHWVAAPPMLPPPEQDVRISLRLLAPATPPQPVEERQADTPARRSRRAHRNRQSRRRHRNPPPRARASWPPAKRAGRVERRCRSPAGGRDRCQSRTGIDHGRSARSRRATGGLPAGAASDQWEARLMARLERYRYYPAAARSRRQQGTAWVRASIDREGRLLALRLEQSSGQPMLDDAALQTFRRAQPLPPIPDELKAPQELVVPVEYYLR